MIWLWNACSHNNDRILFANVHFDSESWLWGYCRIVWRMFRKTYLAISIVYDRALRRSFWYFVFVFLLATSRHRYSLVGSRIRVALGKAIDRMRYGCLAIDDDDDRYQEIRFEAAQKCCPSQLLVLLFLSIRCHYQEIQLASNCPKYCRWFKYINENYIICPPVTWANIQLSPHTIASFFSGIAFGFRRFEPVGNICMSLVQKCAEQMRVLLFEFTNVVDSSRLVQIERVLSLIGNLLNYEQIKQRVVIWSRWHCSNKYALKKG